MRMQSLILIISVAVIMDIMSFKIKNWLICIGILTGTIFQIMEHGSAGLIDATAGVVIPIFCLWILFCLHALGAGDIKLFSVTGCFLGQEEILHCMLSALIIGGIFALCKMFYYKNLGQRFRYFFSYLQRGLQTGVYEPYYKQTEEKTHFTFHFSPAILISVIFICWEGIY